MAASSSSQEHVLGTPELLENILLHLDLAALLTSAQLVERRWRNLISHSAVLQRALFFRGDPTLRHDTALLINQDDNQDNNSEDDALWVEDRFGLNPLLRDKFRPFFHEAGPAAEGEVLSQVPVGRFSNRPLVRSQRCHLTRQRFHAWPLASDGAEKGEAFMRPGASWRRMLVAQPPMQRLGFSGGAGSSMGYKTCRIIELRRPAIDDDAINDNSTEVATQEGKEDGLRMGELYDAAVAWLTVHPALAIMWNPRATMALCTQGTRSAGLRRHDRRAFHVDENGRGRHAG
ncbi:uncharacterized protein PG998_004359 [Apiospora kogelbergensis]|uniref:uncharacterized protein n=1 Tax=Apiospora kogelbergensis TaxID=1337665 RepID=UPI0031316399